MPNNRLVLSSKDLAPLQGGVVAGWAKDILASRSSGMAPTRFWRFRWAQKTSQYEIVGRDKWRLVGESNLSLPSPTKSIYLHYAGTLISQSGSEVYWVLTSRLDSAHPADVALSILCLTQLSGVSKNVLDRAVDALTKLGVSDEEIKHRIQVIYPCEPS